MRPSAAALVLALAAWSGGCADEARAAPARNLLLISIDTLRADRLGCYGYARPTTPAIDRLAEGSLRFERALAESPWTIPSHLTLLTGLHPRSHGVRTPEQRLAASVPTLAEELAREGFFTFAITGAGWMSEEWGFDRGFEFFDASEREFAHVLERAADFVRFRRERGRFFGFLHTFDVHCPYDAPEPLRREFASPDAEVFETEGRCGNPDFNARERTVGEDRHLSDLYDAGVRWVDDALGPFFEFLEAEGAFADTVVVLTSDHGEELGEHGQIGHERSLHAELLRIPLLLRAPGLPAGVSDAPVGLADVMPTVVDLLGLGVPDVDGRSLVSGAESAGAPGVISELAWQREMLSWSDGVEHLILPADAEAELYLWSDDPFEQRDLGAEQSDRRAELEARLQARLGRYRLQASPEDVPDTDATRRAQLKALGYAGEDVSD